ncbi:MAG TPA: hypothetical protein HA252_01410 [Candidatus Diapherotrites archaeon]|uniref:Uncharacterized protein n=1 Tax=Candidatus Iainarchaeum sp. TaxID=3101447 RepID=A0A7J4JE51_9ARCH|nr:hypothetical protein [Candidatus Diapherotrites archaeon]HIH16042.1 hypothetical protein [Candidatus Diapherotrites archaeon]
MTRRFLRDVKFGRLSRPATGPTAAGKPGFTEHRTAIRQPRRAKTRLYYAAALRAAIDSYIEEVQQRVRWDKSRIEGMRQHLYSLSPEQWAAIMRDPQHHIKYKDFLGRARHVMTTTVSGYAHASAIFREMVGDFKGRSNLGVFGFGVGYGTILHILKHDPGFRAAYKRRRFISAKKIGGVELQKEPEELTKRERLNVIHGVKAEDLFARPLRRRELRAREATYSVDFLNEEILGSDPARLNKVAENIARMTQKGGYSYHVLSMGGETGMTRAMFEKQGFRVLKWLEPTKENNARIIKLYKER